MNADRAADTPSSQLRQWGTAAAALAGLGALGMWLRPPGPASGADAALLLALQPGEPLAGTPPLWWLAGRGLQALTGSGLAGWQLAVVGGWVALVWAVWKLAEAAGASGAGRAVAAVAVAAWPTLVWRAGTVGPEVQGVALACVAVWLLSRVHAGRAGQWAGALAAAAAGGVWAPALWIVMPAAVWAARAGWAAGRRQDAAAPASAVAVGAVWAGWWLAGGLAGGRVDGEGAWAQEAAGSPWLGVLALVLAAAGGAAAWRRGRREAVLRPGVWIAAVAAGAALSGPPTLLLAVPAVALLWGELCGAPGRCCRVALLGVAAWVGAAAVWAWPALQARREPAPAWAALGWARERLEPGEVPVVVDPELEAAARLVLVPAGFELLTADTPAARTAIDAGEGPVRIGVRAHPGARVLKAWRWPSGRVQRLVRPGDAACVVSKLERTDPVRVSRSWRKVDGKFELEEEGIVALEAGTPARTLGFKVESGSVRVRMAGRRALELRGESPMFSFVLAPGPAGAMAFEPVGGPVRFAVAELAEAKGGGHPALMVPQAAAVTGIGGSFWQTDLVLANPHAAAAIAEVLFLPSERANPAVRSVRLEVPASGSRLVDNVLGLGEFRQGPRTGALLVRTAGCRPPGCGLVVMSRTCNIQGESCDPIAEGLPGLPPERGVRAGGAAVFEDVTNDATHRGYVGFASWSGVPLRVEAVLRSADGRLLGRLDERLEPWSHRHLRLPASCQGATLTLAVEGSAEGLVFPYLSTVASAENCSAHRYPDRVEGPAAAGLVPRDPATGEGR
ncbi:MAG TPA: hypothetical protein P5234_09815 [Thermoanaerobaculaceae bacterium]|nr:hypothetical protein [Thermoanaerobaculaceae bacterium]HRS16526.1 hypothetical protein [Thermoanaerobaculaceae bacterium]